MSRETQEGGLLLPLATPLTLKAFVFTRARYSSLTSSVGFQVCSLRSPFILAAASRRSSGTAAR